MPKSIEEIANWFEEKLKKDFEGRLVGIKRRIGNFIELEVQVLNDDIKWITIPIILKDGKWDRKIYIRILNQIEDIIKEFEK